MTLEQLLAWIVAVNTIVTFSSTLYTLLSARATKALADLAVLTKKIDDYIDGHGKQHVSEVSATVARIGMAENRILTIESEMKHMPDRTQAHAIQLDLKDLVGRMNVIEERLRPIQATSERLQEYLLEEAAKA